MVEDINSPTYSSDESRKVMRLYGALHRERDGFITISLKEMFSLLEEMDRLRLEWKAAAENSAYHEDHHKKATAELEKLKLELRKSQAELKDARAQIRSQLDEIRVLRAEADAASGRMNLVKDFLKSGFDSLPKETQQQLEFLRNENFVRVNSKHLREQFMEGDTEETMDYDSTGNTLDTLDEDVEEERRARNSSIGLRGRRSVSVHPPSTSKRKSSRNNDPVTSSVDENEETRDSPLPPKRSREAKEITATTTITIDPNKKKPTQAKVTIRRSMNRSMSENDLLASQAKTPTTGLKTPFVPRTTSTLELRTKNSQYSTWTHGEPIAKRPHHFRPISKYTLRMTYCDVCHGGINCVAKRAYKCLDCHQLVHVDCASNIVIPCVPRKLMATRTPSKRAVYHLQDFCPTTPPMIAFPVIYCVVDLENRGLGREGLYRVPGRKDHAQCVLNELRTSRSIPKLCLQETEVVVDVVKSFLRDLRDPLIPKSSREEFIRAASTNNILGLNVAVCDLPHPNRDTLSYLMLHLQRVEALKDVNKMSAENIARCMAIPIMGQSVYPRGDIQTASQDAREKERSVLQMLSMSSEYWRQFLEPDDVRHGFGAGGRTPPSAPPYEDDYRVKASAPPYELMVDQSMLGPVSKTPIPVARNTPRRPQKFFDSPM